MSLIDNLTSKIEQVSANNSDSLGKIADEKMKQTFRLLGGSGSKRTRVPDNIISFVGASGGTGASTLIANVAFAMEKKGYSVLVVDANITYPNQYNYFGYKIGSRTGSDLVSFLNGRCSIGEAIKTKKGISTLYADNRTIMDVINVDRTDKVEEFAKTIESLRDYFDVVLIDLPNIMSYDLVHTCMYVSNFIYIVWDENLSCIANTESLRKNMMLCGISHESKMKLILNKRTSVQYPRTAIDGLGLELEAIVPFDLSIINSGLNAEIYMAKGASFSKNASVFVDTINNLADKILVNAGAHDVNIKDTEYGVTSIDNEDDDEEVENTAPKRKGLFKNKNVGGTNGKKVSLTKSEDTYEDEE